MLTCNPFSGPAAQGFYRIVAKGEELNPTSKKGVPATVPATALGFSFASASRAN
jgi:hypothetical protein